MDIQTRKTGDHVEIVTPKGITINFTPDALDEFLNDVKGIKESESNQAKTGQQVLAPIHPY